MLISIFLQKSLLNMTIDKCCALWLQCFSHHHLSSTEHKNISTSDNMTKRTFSLSELPFREVFCHPSFFSGADVIVFNQNQLKQNDEDESWLCKHTCPPLRVLALTYSSSIWEVKGWKSGMTNFLRKAWVSRTMLLWTHLMNKPQTACNTLWLHASGRKSLSTKCATLKSDKLQWKVLSQHSDQLLLIHPVLSTMASGGDEWLWWVCDRHVWDILWGVQCWCSLFINSHMFRVNWRQSNSNSLLTGKTLRVFHCVWSEVIFENLEIRTSCDKILLLWPIMNLTWLVSDFLKSAKYIWTAAVVFVTTQSESKSKIMLGLIWNVLLCSYHRQSDKMFTTSHDVSHLSERFKLHEGQKELRHTIPCNDGHTNRGAA